MRREILFARLPGDIICPLDKPMGREGGGEISAPIVAWGDEN